MPAHASLIACHRIFALKGVSPEILGAPRRHLDPRFGTARSDRIVGLRARAVIPIRPGRRRGRLDVHRWLLNDDGRWRVNVVWRIVPPVGIRRAPPPRSDTDEHPSPRNVMKVPMPPVVKPVPATVAAPSMPPTVSATTTVAWLVGTQQQ